MKNNERIAYGLIITFVIFIISMFTASKVDSDFSFFPKSFVSHSVMLLLSIAAIYSLKKYVNYKISLPNFKKSIKPILLGFFLAITINITIGLITKALGYSNLPHPLLKKLTPLQVFIFIFLYASIAEELLFRGFLLNFLRPLKDSGITLLGIKISISVIISAVAFGLGHLVLISTGVDGMFLLRIVASTTIIGLVAGYYQEKYDNNAYAIMAHMAVNLIAVISAVLVHLVK